MLAWLDDHDTPLLAGLTGAVCIGSLLAVGTVHVPVLLLVAPIAVATAALAIWREGWDLGQLPRASIVLLLLAGYTALQALPLPLDALRAIAPNNADVWSRALHGFAERPPAWATLSLDPGATRVEALKWLTYASMLLSGAVLGIRLGARAGAAIVFGAAGLAAVITILHALTGAEKLYGIYEPTYARRVWALGPLLNPNNLAGYLNLGAFTGVGLLVASRTPGPRWLMAIAVATTMAVSLLTGSRGGAAALIVGALLIVPALRGARHLARHRVVGHVETWVEIAAVVLGAAALFLLGVNRQVYDALLQEGAEKLAIAGWTRPMIADHVWLGVGRGAYETVFPAYDLDHSHMLFQYAENFVAQWISEWGLPVGGGALLGLAAALRPGRLRAFRDPVAAGALVGVLVLLLQNLVDLAVEITSVSIALFLLLGALWGGARRHAERAARQRCREGVAVADAAKREAPPAGSMPSSPRPSAPPMVRLPRALLPPGLAAAGLVSTWLASHGLERAVYERDTLAALYQANADRGPAAHAAFMRELRAAILRHPSDPHFYLVGALASLRDGQNPLRWVGLAIERDRSSGRPYLVLAEALARAGAEGQALDALRTMLEREFSLLGAALPIALRISREPEELARMAPDGQDGAEALSRLAERLDRADTGRRERLLALAIAHDPRYDKPRLLDAEDLFRALRPDSASTRCAGDARARCLRRVEEHARVAETVAPTAPHAVMLRARVLLLQDQPQQAEQLLARGCPGVEPPLECLKLRIEAAKTSEDPAALQRAVADFLELECREPRRCAGAHVFVGNVYTTRKDWRAAAEHFEHAAFGGNDANAWLRVVTAAARAGDLVRSKRAFDRARAAGLRPDPKQLEAAQHELMRETRERSSATP